ncbi:MAG: hypothetical protein K1X74_13895 [Pirellulales bacterium]|nr:hypothetical protein [Pirellulales bacterium]
MATVSPRTPAAIALVTVLAAVSSILPGPSAQAQSWRAENRVYRGDERKPISHSVTLAEGTQIFDQLVGEDLATVYDQAGKRCTLLNPAGGVQVELSAAEVAAFEQGLRTWCGQQSEPVLRFLADPRFEERFDAEAGRLSLEHRWLSYQAQVTPAPAGVTAAAYVEYTSFLARVNAMLHPGGLPPFGRLALDRSLAAHRVVAQSIELRYTAGTGKQARTVRLRSEHEFSTQRLDDDAQRVQGLRRQLATLRRVGFPEYQASIQRQVANR